MKKATISLFLSLTSFLILLNCEQPIKLEKAKMEYVQTQLNKFAPVKIGYDKSILSDKDQQVVEKLVAAADYIDKIFLQQAYSKNEKILAALKKSGLPEEQVYFDFFNAAFRVNFCKNRLMEPKGMRHNFSLCHPTFPPQFDYRTGAHIVLEFQTYRIIRAGKSIRDFQEQSLFLKLQPVLHPNM